MTATLEAQLVTKQAESFLVRSATKGKRLSVEKHFENRLLELLNLWNTELADLLLESGVLDAAQRQARVLKASDLTDEEYKKATEGTITQLFALAFDTIIESDLRRALSILWTTNIILAYELGAIVALEHLGVNAMVKRVATKAAEVFVFELTDAEVIAALENRAIKYGRGLTAETIQDARSAVKDGFFLGTKTIDEVAATIRAGNGTSAWRALKIARTETQAAYSTAMFDMYYRSGVRRKRWLTVGDQRVRPSHVDNASAGWLTAVDTFPSGQLHPGEGVDSVNCRCSLQADLDDPQLILTPWDGSGFSIPPSVPIA